MEDYFRAARAHGIELPFSWTVTLPEDKPDPAEREVPFRGRDGEWSERMRQEHMRPTIERFVIDNDMEGWEIRYQRVRDGFGCCYHEVSRTFVPEPDPALMEALMRATDQVWQEWRANDGLSELTKRRLGSG